MFTHLNRKIQIVVQFMFMETLFVVWCWPAWLKRCRGGQGIYLTRLCQWSVQTKAYSTQAHSSNVYIYNLADIISFTKSLKFPNPKFSILNFVQFASGSTMRSAEHKLKTFTRSNKWCREFLFFCLPKLHNSLNPLQW